MLNALTENAGRIPGFSITVSQSVASCVSVSGFMRSRMLNWRTVTVGLTTSLPRRLSFLLFLAAPTLCMIRYTHTHAHLTAVCPGLRTWAGTRKVKPMQVYTSLQTDIHTSTPQLSFFTGQVPFLPPNQQHQSTKGTVWYNGMLRHSMILYSAMKVWQRSGFIYCRDL